MSSPYATASCKVPSDITSCGLHGKSRAKIGHRVNSDLSIYQIWFAIMTADVKRLPAFINIFSVPQIDKLIIRKEKSKLAFNVPLCG